jgi:hypothetical protein
VEKLVPKDEVFLEDMDLDVDIENIDFPDNEKRLQDRREVASEIETQEQSSSEDELFTLKNDLFDKISKKIIFERLLSKNKRIKGKSNSYLGLGSVPPSKISRINKATGEALEVLVDDMEIENACLKERIK